MTADEARGIVAVLAAAYPSATLEPETVALYVAQFSRLESLDAAKATVQTLLDGSKHMPTLAEFRETYNLHRRREREELARAPALAEPGAPMPEEVRRLIARIGRSPDGGTAAVEERTATLETVKPGRCDDCGQDSVYAERRRLGRFTLCQSCAGSRLRVALDLRREQGAAA